MGKKKKERKKENQSEASIKDTDRTLKRTMDQKTKSQSKIKDRGDVCKLNTTGVSKNVVR
jgi:hypothetical protein